MQTGILTLLGKTVSLMESLGFLWLVHTGFELDLWKLLQQERSKEELLELNPHWNPILLDHWLEQAKIQGLLLRNNSKYTLTRIGKAVDFYRDYGLEAMYKEFALYWGPTFAELPHRITGHVSPVKMENEMENELISKASRASELFVWPLLKAKCEKEHWQRVLDVGCGEGIYLRKLVEEFPGVQGVGIDVNSSVVERAKHLAKSFEDRLHFDCLNILDHDPPLEKYDCCLMNNNLYYFSFKQRQELLERIKSWLVPGGRIGILTALRGENSSIPFIQTHIPQNLMSFFLACHEGFEGLPYEQEITKLLRDLEYREIEVIPLPLKVSHYFFAQT